MIYISRKRWVITRNDGKEMFCGLARHYMFKPVGEIGGTAIKTYISRNNAISAFNRSWSDWYDDDFYKAVEIIETITEQEAQHD